jgi:hypothetical protein
VYLRPVTRRRTLRMAVALLAAVAGGQVARAAAGLNGAAACCASHCRHTVPSPGRCCTVQTPSADPTLLPAPVHPDPAPVAMVCIVPLPGATRSASSSALAPAVGCRGAPPFLLACNLRL